MLQVWPSLVRRAGSGALLLALALSCGAALAQDATSDWTAAVQPAPAVQPPPTAQPVIAAKTLFGAVKVPAAMPPHAVGEYAKGCLAGAQALPINGRAWQVMRLSRNRNWGHPALVDFLQRYAEDVQAYDGWPGLLVGDMSQPRGGPMLTGHASHQLGLDTDLWFQPMPDRRLSPQEREQTSAISVVSADKLSVDTRQWTDAHTRIIKRAASSPNVERVFVHPAIKKELCQKAGPEASERAWLAKVRPWWGHDDHYHVRIGCPKDSPSCRPQKSIPGDDGCGKELADWFKLITAPPAPPKPDQSPPRPMTLDALPGECRVVLRAGATQTDAGRR